MLKADSDTKSDSGTKSDRGGYVSRHQARIAAMQMLFAALFETGNVANSMQKRLSVSSFVKQSAMNDDYVLAIAEVFDNRREEIDNMLSDALSIPISQLSMTERTILSLAIAELLSQPLTVANIVMDEAIILAKEYGTEGGYRIVNGALNAVIASLKV